RYTLTVGAGQSRTIRLRLTARDLGDGAAAFDRKFDAAFDERRREADEFYHDVIPTSLSEDAQRVIRQGYSGLLWTKQAYVYDVEGWLKLRGISPSSPDGTRNQQWPHMYS